MLFLYYTGCSKNPGPLKCYNFLWFLE